MDVGELVLDHLPLCLLAHLCARLRLASDCKTTLLYLERSKRTTGGQPKQDQVKSMRDGRPPVSTAISLNVMYEAFRLYCVTVRRPANRVVCFQFACICTSLKA